MASPTRSSSSRGRPAASRSSSGSGGNNQQMLILGGIAVAVVVVVFFMMSGGGNGKTGTPTPAAPAAKPAEASKPPAAPAAVSSSAKDGKTPAKAAPALTADTLGQVRAKYEAMKGFYNEGSKARTDGDNATARDKQAKAKDVLDEIDAMLKAPLLWQEEAEMEGWSQPAEYVEMAKLYGDVMSLAKKVRMGGGK